MKIENISPFYQLARQLRKQELNAKKRLITKIIKLYKPYLRPAPNLAGDNKIVCVTNTKTGNFDEIYVTKDVYIMGYFNDGKLMTDGCGGGLVTENLISFNLPTLLKIYEITEKLFNKGYKKFSWG